MKHSLSTRLLSLLLVFSLLVPCFPMAASAEMTDAAVVETTEATESPEIILTEEETVPEETEDPTEATVPAVPEETVPEETVPEETVPEETVPEETVPEETVPVETVPEETVPEETVPEETVPEETVPDELPNGFLGMPEGYVRPQSDLDKLASMKAHQVLKNLTDLVPGENYVKNQIKVSAASEEEALLIAQAYCGELADFANGLALINLSGSTVLDAVSASMDETANLPVASPNYTFRLEEPMFSSPAATFGLNPPTRQTWNDWIHDTLGDYADTNLLEPWRSDYQYMHDVVDSYAAWGVTTGLESVRVAVIDSGVDAYHPDLGVVESYNMGFGTTDLYGHGTHVAGIISATLGNARGGAGIAPDVTVMGFRISDNSHEIDDYTLIQSIYTAVDNDADIINMSLGYLNYDADFQTAVDDAYDNGVTVIAAMGNNGSNTINYPAAYDHVIAVGATDKSNRRAFFSNFGDWADVSAPGVDIFSTYPTSKGSYTMMDGTSMACPVVVGVVALYISALGYNPGPDAIEKALKSSATKCSDSGMGAGIVNLANMLDSKPAAPSFYLIHDDTIIYDYEEYAGQEIPCDTILDFGLLGQDQNWYVLYTLDGKTPSVKNGQIVNGTYYDWEGIYLNEYAGQTVTLKAVQVSGMGVVGTVMTEKIKVGYDSQVSSVEVEGPEILAAGRNGQFVATVFPAETANQQVTWSIDSPTNISGISIDKNGVLTTPASFSGDITVRGTSVAVPTKSDTAIVTVTPAKPVAKITLNAKTMSLYTGDNTALDVTYITDTAGNRLYWSDVGIQFTSSNKKVATVDAYSGRITALSKGSATITAKALDGSNKTAKCTVTVKQQVETITITGNASVAPGASTTLKAAVTPSTANTKTVSWSVDSNSYNRGVRISTSGKLTVPSNYNWSAYPDVLVHAHAKDGQGANQTYSVTVKPQITYAEITLNEAYLGLAKGAEYNKSGKLTTVNLFSVDLNESDYRDNYCDLWYAVSGGYKGVTHSWTSSNPSVASVDFGYVTAHKAGTAKITFKALDGSNKTSSITIKVTNPVSYMDIKTSAPQMSNEIPYIGIGKTVSNKVTFGNTYGKPANQKVDWSYQVIERDILGNDVYDWTPVVSENNWVKLSKSGSLTVTKEMGQIWASGLDQTYVNGEWYYNELFVEIIAVATDGTGTPAVKSLVIIPPSTYLQPEHKSYIGTLGKEQSITFYSDQWHLFENLYECGFVATSSNPKVASVTGIGAVGSDAYKLYFYAGKKGSAKITIKATDGSNKSCSFTVTVKEAIPH